MLKTAYTSHTNVSFLGVMSYPKQQTGEMVLVPTGENFSLLAKHGDFTVRPNQCHSK
jgi:hypothetical protein